MLLGEHVPLAGAGMLGACTTRSSAGVELRPCPVAKTLSWFSCAACNGTGYKGRVGLYEVMEVTEDMRELILVGASGLELRRKAIEEGMLTLRLSGLEKIRQGLTTVEEVVRETVK